jgi:hypothetical protein
VSRQRSGATTCRRRRKTEGSYVSEGSLSEQQANTIGRSAGPRLVTVRKSDDREAAEVLRRLLDAVDRGQLTADTPAERRNLRRLAAPALHGCFPFRLRSRPAKVASFNGARVRRG